ncbi:MAG TPA: hypothetical protein VGH19_01350 [Verrucomicrobiae bacterium]
MKYVSCKKIMVSIVSLMLLMIIGFPTKSDAIVLDWSSYTSLTWTQSGSTYSTSIDFDPSNAGNDITISISGDTGEFLTGYPYYSPGVNSIITGGEGNNEESLLLAFNWSSRSDSVTVTLNFHYADGIENLEFSLFDIDRLDEGNNSGFRDYISNIQASNDGGANVIPTLTQEDDDYVTIANKGKSSQTARGDEGSADNSDNANVDFDFGTNVVDQVSFQYGNHSSAPSNPGQQGIGLYDISFNKAKPKVPEVGTNLAAFCLCACVVLGRYIRRYRTAG